MKSETNQKQSDSMKAFWKTNRSYMMGKRKQSEPEALILQGERIKQHFKEHPEHSKAISEAQKNKWQKYKKALAYCLNNNISFMEKD
jgi:hypothetical protein